ncbi:class I SAM-dependent methyltransferase [Ekhidna sp. To15]|uniref:class I SAM-dependent methyltransferase n=1 Tax=Ekhidna sp. To15 TaxID=3395267 RepID=UPI003F51C202
MYEKLDQCPVCKNKQFDNYMICNDHSVSGESFALVKCVKCHLVFTNPRPEETNLAKYYQSDQYISHTDQGNSLINIIYKIVRSYTLNSKTRLLAKINGKKGKLLDYGCGTGAFLKKATQKGWQAFGYEPDLKARDIARSKNPETIINSINDCPNDLDIITAWHVIEHVAQLRETIKSLSQKLRNGGYLIIAVPNHKSFDAKHYKEYWAAYDVPRHLYHFDTDSLVYLAKQMKLKLVDTLPMKFDAYYVSMLSEKYANNGSLLNALVTGYKSNLKASISGQYSSLIYVLKK